MNCVHRFSVKPPKIWENRVKMSICVNFADKSDQTVAREKSYRLKPDFYNTVRKMKNIIRRIFTSIFTHPIFMHVCLQISFKNALESFTVLPWVFFKNISICLTNAFCKRRFVNINALKWSKSVSYFDLHIISWMNKYDLTNVFQDFLQFAVLYQKTPPAR